MSVSANRTKYLTAAAGALGFLLRVLLYTAGRDDSGLLIRGHWAGTALLILTATVAVGIRVLTRPIPATVDSGTFPASPMGSVGAAAAALAILLSPGSGGAEDSMALAETVLRFASAIALAVIGFCRFRGRRPNFLLHCILCLYLAIRLVCQYRIWSAAPQLQDYIYFLAAHVTLMLTCYQFAAADAGLGNPRKLWAFGLASVYLCAVSLWGEGEPLLMTGCGIWVFTNLRHFTTVKQEESI